MLGKITPNTCPFRLLRTVPDVGDDEPGSVQNVHAKGDVAIDTAPVENRLCTGEVFPAANAPSANRCPVAAADDEIAVDAYPVTPRRYVVSRNSGNDDPIRPRRTCVVRACLGHKSKYGEYERQRNRGSHSRPYRY